MRNFFFLSFLIYQTELNSFNYILCVCYIFLTHFINSIQQLYCYSVQYHMRHNLAFTKGQNYPSQCRNEKFSTTYMASLLKKKVVISDCHIFYIRKLCVPFILGFANVRVGGLQKLNLINDRIQSRKMKIRSENFIFIFHLFAY